MIPTLELRFLFLVTSYEWTTGFEPRGTKKLQQKWVNSLGQEIWQDVPMVTEEIENCPYYG